MFKKNYRVRRIILSCVLLGLATPAAQAAIPLLLYETAYAVAEVLPLVVSTCHQLITLLAHRPVSLDQKALTTIAPQPVAIKITHPTECVCAPEFTIHINTRHQQAYKNVFDFVMQSCVDKKELSAEWGHLASKSMGQAFRANLRDRQLHQQLQQRIALAVERFDVHTKIQNDPVFAVEYQHAFDFVYSRILDVVRYHTPSNYALRVETLLDLNNIHLPGLAGQIFSNFREELNALCFDVNGRIKDVLPDKEIANLVALFIKTCSTDQKSYITKLQAACASGAIHLDTCIQKASKEQFSKAEYNPFSRHPNLHTAIIHNTENQQLYKLINSCKQGNFQQASTYAHTPINKRIYTLFYNTVYHSYGIPRLYDADPLVKNLSSQDKVALKNSLAIRTGFIKELENRFQIKQHLMRSCSIPETHSTAVSDALYNAIPFVGKHEEFLKYCNQFCNGSTPEHAEICAAFFTPDGILKIWEQYTTPFKGLNKPTGLNLPENTALRLQTNRLLLITPAGVNSSALQQAYKYCTAASYASESLQDIYCAMAEKSALALYVSHEHSLILSCPDCTQVYATPEQNAVQQLIMQRFIQATQITDQAKKAVFTNQIAPLLQRAYQYNHEGHGLIANAVIIAADNHDQIKHIGQGLGSIALVALGYKFFEQAKNRLQRQGNQQPVSQKPSANAPDPEDPEKDKSCTNKQDKEDAKKLGFKLDKDPPFKTHGKKAFRKGNRWISADRDGHRGGRWKMFNEKGTRLGTFDKDLNIIAT